MTLSFSISRDVLRGSANYVQHLLRSGAGEDKTTNLGKAVRAVATSGDGGERRSERNGPTGVAKG